MTALLIVAVALLVVSIVLQIVIFFRKVQIDAAPIQAMCGAVEKSSDRIERSVREEIATNREEASASSRQAREELGNTLKVVGDSINRQLESLTQTNDGKLDKMRDGIFIQLQGLQEAHARQMLETREEAAASAKLLREEVIKAVKTFGDSIISGAAQTAEIQKSQLQLFSDRLESLSQTNEQRLAVMRQTIDDKMKAVQEEIAKQLTDARQQSAVEGKLLREDVHKLTEENEKRIEGLRVTVDERLKLIQDGSSQKFDEIRLEASTANKQMREELNASLKNFNDSVVITMKSVSDSQKQEMETFTVQLGKLTDSNQQRLDALKTAVEDKLKSLQEDNTKQLDLMRNTVDEKLQTTLDKRLGESFTRVSERLEAVQKGLGEMQVLASGVGDLKKVLTNVKTRGTWGEVQLGALLEQVLTQDQFGTNVAVKEGGERVEFAIKLPGRGDDVKECIWLPIDAKFPIEDYQRLVDAQERADSDAIEVASKQLQSRVKQCAVDICEKYICPPHTTDFGILFLPTEGLFAEVIRSTGLSDFVQRECRVVIAGPTTLWSILSSLQMGFRTLAIQERSSEVWNLLSAVKTEWATYAKVLSKVQKKIQEASNNLDEAAKRTRVIGKKLKDVQELPAIEAGAVLQLGMQVEKEPEPETA